MKLKQKNVCVHCEKNVKFGKEMLKLVRVLIIKSFVISYVVCSDCAESKVQS